MSDKHEQAADVVRTMCRHPQIQWNTPNLVAYLREQFHEPKKEDTFFNDIARAVEKTNTFSEACELAFPEPVKIEGCVLYSAYEKPSQMVIDMGYVPKKIYGTGVFKDPINTWLLSHDETKPLAFDTESHIIEPSTLCIENTDFIRQRETGKWQEISTAPWGTEILLTGSSGYVSPHSCFVINGYRVKDWHNGGWNDATGTRLTERGWFPTHWQPLPPAPKESWDESNE